MARDVIITPASGLIDFQGSVGISSATIELDTSGNLNIANPGGDLTLGDTSRDVYIGNGVANVDIIFEQSGEIRALTGKTLTLGQSDSNVTVATNLTVSGDVGIGTNNPTSKLEVSGVIKDAGGNLRSLPNNAKSTSYTLTADDVGELINITTGGVTVPASVFSAGNSVTIYNNSGSPQTITQGSGVTLRLAGVSTTGNRTLDQRGLANVLCVGSNEFVISGAGLS